MTDSTTDIAWHSTLESARQNAADNNRLVLTYLHAPG